MESELYEINVTLSNDQKQKIRNAFINREKIRLRLTKDALRGSDTLLVPTSFFEEMDNEDGIDAVVDEQTKKEMQDEMREELEFLRDKNLAYEMLKDKTDEEIWECFKRFFKAMDESLANKLTEFVRDINLSDGNLSDEMFEDMINQHVWEYYKLFFHPAIEESMENKGIEFDLDYSLVNDLAKDFVKDNIKKLFE